MSEKLDRILEYCDLETRFLHGTGLLDDERARLERLRDQLSTQVPALDERDSYTVLAGSSVINAQLRNVSTSGVALATDAQPPNLSQRVKVVARDVQRGFEYVFAGYVISRVVKGAYGMAIQLEGMPSRLRLGGQSGVFPRGGTAARDPDHPAVGGTKKNG
jgi:hypothetical protein